MRELISEIERRLDEPTARGLATAVSRAIREGAVVAGQRLPPIRDLAHELALSPTTVSSAWGLLTRAGTIQTAGRRGTVVTDGAIPREGRYRQAIEHDNVFTVDLSTGVPDASLLPTLERALQSLTTAGTPQSYLDEPVLPELQAMIEDTWPYRPCALTVVDGALDALELIIRTQLRFGDRVIVEHPTFPPLLDLLEAGGLRVAGIRMDEEGIVPAELERALRKPAQALFLQPRAQNPTGISSTSQRLAALADLLRDRELLVVEDDSANGISVSPDLSLGTLLPGSTVHIRSYSKSHGPDLRLAAISGPEHVITSVRHLRQLGQGWSSRLLQRLLLNLLSDERTIADVMAARDEYARRRQVFATILADHGIETVGNDGINMWVPVIDEAAALMRLASRGIGAAPGAPFRVFKEESGHVRLTVGLLNEELEGVAREVVAAARTGRWGERAR